jgi:hypothetical protein
VFDVAALQLFCLALLVLFLWKFCCIISRVGGELITAGHE